MVVGIGGNVGFGRDGLVGKVGRGVVGIGGNVVVGRFGMAGSGGNVGLGNGGIVGNPGREACNRLRAAQPVWMLENEIAMSRDNTKWKLEDAIGGFLEI
ncbi:hypothetical protein ACS0TY_028803 [Phlomoides rotata]